MALWLGMSSRVFFVILSMLLVYAWARSRHRTHVKLALACQRSMILAQRKLRLTMQHVYGPVIIWKMKVLTMPLHLGPHALPQATTLPFVGFTIILMLLSVLMAVTTLLRSLNDHNAFERMLRPFPKIGVSIVFSIEFVVFVVHFTCPLVVRVCCSQSFLLGSYFLNK